MKKIIATVLAMVMALALCTTAFAALPEGATRFETAGKETYYKLNNEYYTDEECTKLVTAGVKEILSATNDGQYTTTLPKQYKVAAAVTCTTDGWKVNVYIDAAKKLYIKDTDKTAYEDKYNTSLSVGDAKYFGTKIDNVEKYYEVQETNVKMNKGHVIATTTDTYGETKTPVYKCVICGATYISATVTLKDADKAATAKFDRISYTAVDAADAAQVMFDKGFLNADQAATGTYIQLKAGSTDTKTDGKDSPKTFDAGIAMYVGMALTSVAGSAVVIGKKKEF